jgi:hypothetical protein
MRKYTPYGSETTISSIEIQKTTVSITATGTVLTPQSNKYLRLYSVKFSTTADISGISFRFGSGGSDFERYLSVVQGGLYGFNAYPNYIQGNVDEVLYCSITGTSLVQINIDYVES